MRPLLKLAIVFLLGLFLMSHIPICTYGQTVVNVSITQPPQLSANAGTNQTVSANQSIQLGGFPSATGGAAGYTYLWSPSTGLNNPAVANPTATVNSSTTYSLKVTDANGCSATSSINLTLTNTGTNSELTFIPANSLWKYLDNGSNQGTSWTATSFSDINWKQGNAQLGYGDGDEATVVSYGSNASAKYPTTYFRKTFSISDLASITALTLNLIRDDGAVVYLNGVEVFRSNMPTGTIAYNTYASSNIDVNENVYLKTTIDKNALVIGTNVLAVEIHQSNASSSDISFNASLIATTTSSPCLLPAQPSAITGNTTVTSGSVNVYSVPVVTGATSYKWTLPTGWSGTSTTNSISVTAGSTNGTISVAAVNTCGTSAASNVAIAVTTPCTIPAQPGAITGNTTVTSGSVNVYSVPVVSSATSYKWTLPTGWSGTSTTNSISVTSGSTNGTISVAAVNTCGTSVASNLAIAATTPCTIPAQPGAITGNTTVTSGSVNVYSVPQVTGATFYKWTLPTGWSGTSTTNSISVTSGSTNGTISVAAVNTCGTSATSNLAIAVTTPCTIPAQPGAITGNTTVTSGSVNVYSVPVVSGATSYKWTLPTGWTGTSTTNSISVTAGSMNGTISVAAVNACGTSAATNLAISVTTPCTIPAQPAAITGNTTVTSGSVNVYSIPVVSGASSYKWTLPAGWTGTSTTNSISVTAGSTNGTISVAAVNACGTSAPGSLVVSITTASGPVTFIPLNSSWKYLDNGSNQGTSWRTLSYSDLNWKQGNAELGYGDGGEATVVSYGSNASAKYITTYFRKTFQVNDIATLTSLSLQLMRDDGAVVYLNGTEVFRSNMPTGTIAYNTLATSAVDASESNYYSASLNKSLLVGGTNLIAVEIHQASASSSDISFNMSLTGISGTTTNCTTAPAQPGTISGNTSVSSGTMQTYSITDVTGATSYKWTIPSGWTGSSTTKSISVTTGTTGGNITVAAVNACGTSSAAILPVTVSTVTQNPSTVKLIRGPYLQLGTPTTIYIKWRTDISCNSKIAYGTSPSSLSSVVSSTTDVIDHELKISGLTPNTKYYYQVGTTTASLQGDAENYFITAPASGTTKTTRIWAIGDAGSNAPEQNMVRDAYYAYTGSTYTDVWLWMGDNAYTNGTDAEYQIDVFSNHYEKILKQTVAWPTLGNHDYAQSGYQSSQALGTSFAYFDIFRLPANGEAGGVPSGTEKYYSFNYSNIHFICLDSYGSLNTASSPMVTWLKNDLAANTQKWTIVYFHHPPYSKGNHDSDLEKELINMRTNVVPVLEQYKVDLVLSGHSHSYERSYLLKGHYGAEATLTAAMKINGGSGKLPTPYVKNGPDFSGTVYSVVGCSGKLNGTSAGWPHDAMYYSINTKLGSMVIDVDANALTARFIDKDKTVLDEFTIQKDLTSAIRTSTFSMDDPATAPDTDPLSVYPNPYSEETIINYSLNAESKVSLEVYDVHGNRVESVVTDANQKAGYYQFVFSAKQAGYKSGVYFVKLFINEKMYTRKLIQID